MPTLELLRVVPPPRGNLRAGRSTRASTNARAGTAPGATAGVSRPGAGMQCNGQQGSATAELPPATSGGCNSGGDSGTTPVM